MGPWSSFFVLFFPCAVCESAQTKLNESDPGGTMMAKHTEQAVTVVPNATLPRLLNPPCNMHDISGYPLTADEPEPWMQNEGSCRMCRRACGDDD
jgi:hypothetical protein